MIFDLTVSTRKMNVATIILNTIILNQKSSWMQQTLIISQVIMKNPMITTLVKKSKVHFDEIPILWSFILRYLCIIIIKYFHSAVSNDWHCNNKNKRLKSSNKLKHAKQGSRAKRSFSKYYNSNWEKTRPWLQRSEKGIIFYLPVIYCIMFNSLFFFIY